MGIAVFAGIAILRAVVAVFAGRRRANTEATKDTEGNEGFNAEHAEI